MIKPTYLWGLFKSCDDSKWLGDICRSLGRQDISLDYGQKMIVKAIMQDSEWMDERIEAQREKWRKRQRKCRENSDIRDNGDNGDNSTEEESHAVSPEVTVHPSVRPSVRPSEEDNNIRSVTVPLPTEPNENQTGMLIVGEAKNARKLAAEFAAAVTRDNSAFFDASFDAVTICQALTGDYKSSRRWRQLTNGKGEDKVREECFSFYREIMAGEEPANRGATLNARLSALTDNN